DTTADEVYNAIISSMYDGKVILMHHNDCSAEALERLCPELYAQDYRFCTLSQLFSLQGIDYEDIPTGQYIQGVTVENGEVVYNFK
ncbi:MAG: hypothetical protein J6S13_08215, partial [Clostridia bacterium]|nr:hypothetical protein [Clostridia bacterium]